MNLDPVLRSQLTAFKRKLDAYEREIKGERKRILKEAAQPVIMAARARAPVSIAVHYRYGRGTGRVVAEYHPGNLQRSVRVLNFRRSPDVFVGPALAQGGTSGVFKGSRVDAYYAHFVEFGTSRTPAQPFMRPGFYQSRALSMRIIEAELTKLTASFARRNQV